jgi:hypothetical protein
VKRAPYMPQGLTDADGHPKAPHHLIEYSSTIFDTSLDDADREFDRLAGATPPDQIRARQVADDALAIMRGKGDHFAKVRKHIASLGLTLPRLARLNRFARSNAMPYFRCAPDADSKEPGITWGEWRAASGLVHRAALSMLLDVPARNCSDAMVIAELVRDALDPPAQAQRRKVAKRLAYYFTAMLDGQQILGGPKQQAWSFGSSDYMAPAFPAGSKAVIEYHHGKLVPGGYYIFRFRTRYRRGQRPIYAVRRLSHITPTGRWAVEIFKGEDGKPSLDYFSSKHWRPFYRIVRHCR